MLRRPVHDCHDCELHHDGGCAFAPKTLAAQTVLTPQGAVAGEVSFVRSGMVTLSAVSASGEQTWGAVRGPRSVLGVEAIDGISSSCEVRALTQVEVCAATVPAVTAWLDSRAGARRLFSLTLAELLEQRRDVDFRTGTAEARVARFALACERYLGKRGDPLELPKRRVAELVGIRPETLSRVFKKFSARGWVDAAVGLKVLDRGALMRVAEG